MVWFPSFELPTQQETVVSTSKAEAKQIQERRLGVKGREVHERDRGREWSGKVNGEGKHGGDSGELQSLRGSRFVGSQETTAPWTTVRRPGIAYKT